MRRTLLALLVSFTAAACGGQSAGTDTDANAPGAYEIPDGKEDTLNPTGTDQLGKLTVTHPDAGSTGLTAYAPSAYLVGRDIVYTTPSKTRLVAGARQVGLYLHNGPPYELATFDIIKNATTTITLAGIHFDHFGEYATTIGARPYWSTSRPALLQDIGHAGLAGRYLEVLPTAFTLTLAADKPIASFDVAVTAGKVTTQDLAMADPRFGMDVIAPDRTLPDAMAKRILKPLWATQAQLLATYGVNVGAKLVQGADAVALLDGAYHTALGNDVTAQHLFLFLNGSWTEVTSPSNAVISLPIRRLDVGDVAVTNEDGDTTLVRGQYRIEWQLPTGVASAPYLPIADGKSFATNTGLDVVPGNYRVTVTYPRQEEPSPGTSVYEIVIK